MIDQLTGTTWIGQHRDAAADVPHLLLYPAPDAPDLHQEIGRTAMMWGLADFTSALGATSASFNADDEAIYAGNGE